MKTKRKPARSGPGALLRRLLARIGAGQPPDEPAEAAPAAEEPLAPEGRRSGRGARSIAPYLDHARNTRPGSLE